MLLTLKKKNKKGFTLIELIVVVAILAILAAIAVPSFIGLQERAQNGVEVGCASSLVGAINVYNALNEATPIAAANDAALTTLGTLAPTFDSSVTMADVYARIDFNNGVAYVSDTSLE